MMGTWNHEGGTSVDKLIILIINISTMLSHDVGYSGVERGRIETGWNGREWEFSMSWEWDSGAMSETVAYV
jgi:hypothetical protein